MKTAKQRVNDEIKLSPLRVISQDGEQMGIVERDDALRMAQEAGLDLVEVAPNSRPPVCRIMDYGKFKYRQSKRTHKGKHHEVHMKEVRIRPKTDDHDRDVKIKRARRFLEDGDKVTVNMLFRGREVTHMDYAQQNMQAFVDELADVAKVERSPTRVGRRMILILAPRQKQA